MIAGSKSDMLPLPRSLRCKRRKTPLRQLFAKMAIQYLSVISLHESAMQRFLEQCNLFFILSFFFFIARIRYPNNVIYLFFFFIARIHDAAASKRLFFFFFVLQTLTHPEFALHTEVVRMDRITWEHLKWGTRCRVVLSVKFYVWQKSHR